MPSATASVPKLAAICGSEVARMVPSSSWMKKTAATSQAMTRERSELWISVVN